MATRHPVEHLSKRYYRGATGASGALLSEQMGHALRAARPAPRATEPPASEPFWALRDVSLEVAPGEVVGLIGPNGAGKSTLLKLLARITPPTEGRIELRGRVASLLEVGTGFHPELTGRENVYLNGAILGLSRQEIARRFDEIVEFSGVEKFIDTPVKRYSSGMSVRLGFAVAAHLDAEIMLVDEVLAVGDAAFQRKCMDKIRELTVEEGRTIVFVSHNLAWVERLCDRVVLIENGVIAAHGPVAKVIAGYLSAVDPAQHGGAIEIADDAPRLGTGNARFRRVAAARRRRRRADGLAAARTSRSCSRPSSRCTETIEEAVLEVGINAVDGLRIVTSMSTDGGRPADAARAGRPRAPRRARARAAAGRVRARHRGARARQRRRVDFVERVLQFGVGASATARRRPTRGGVRGYLRAETRWELRRAAATARLDP